MALLVFNYQVGNPNTTFPPSLTVKSSDAGVSINVLAPTHRYIAFGLASTPSFSTLIWTPTDEFIRYYTTSSLDPLTATFLQFETVNPSTVGIIGFYSDTFGVSIPIRSISNFASYTNLSFILVDFTLINEIDLENIQIKENILYPVPPQVEIEYNLSLSSISNLPTFPDTTPLYNFYGNNFPKTSIDNILIEIDNLGALSGTLDINNGGGLGNNDTFTLSGAGESAYNNLISKNWTVYYNSPGLPQLQSNDDSTTIINWVAMGSLSTGTIDQFNSAIGTNYELVTDIEIINQIAVTNLYINSYVNLTYVGFIGLDISYISVKYLYSLQSLLIINCNLSNIEFASYYKNLITVELNDNALDENSVNNLFIALDANNKQGGGVNITGGTNAVPTGDGLTAKNNLVAKGWDIYTN